MPRLVVMRSAHPERDWLPAAAGEGTDCTPVAAVRRSGAERSWLDTPLILAVVGTALTVCLDIGAAAAGDDAHIHSARLGRAGTPEGARRSGWDHIMPAPIPEGRSFAYALTIKQKVRCPVISVEGWRDPLRIAAALERIDAVSLSRPFIREPHLAARWRDGDLAPATCISCNTCLDLILDDGLGCIFHERARRTATADA